MIKLFSIILLMFILYLLYKNKSIEGFGKSLPTIKPPKGESSVFVHFYDNNGNMLNVVAISKPFSSLLDYKTYLTLKSKFNFIGISSYMEFPGLPSNPVDNYKDFDIHYKDFDNYNLRQPGNIYYTKMYHDICDLWLHCFKNPRNYLPEAKNNILISESDFINYKNHMPDKSIEKEFDYMYNCPKVSDNSSCDDWVSHNKNWTLAQKCIEILSGKFKLKGLLVGRKNCKLPDYIEKNIKKTGWLNYGENLQYYKKCKFLLIPNRVDASPRVITEAMCYNLPILVNENILGGWKYVNNTTGITFSNIKDFEQKIPFFIKNLGVYEPRNHIINNYGPQKTGKKLKEFLYANIGNINIPKEEVEYITIRSPIYNFSD